MSQKKVPITRLTKFFGQEDFALDISMGEEWLHGDMNFTLVLYRVDARTTKTDDVYGEVVSDGIKFFPPSNSKGMLRLMHHRMNVLETLALSMSSLVTFLFLFTKNI